MRRMTWLYYILALAVFIILLKMALPFFFHLLPGFKLAYTIFPAVFILLTHYSPAEIIRAFRMAGRESSGSHPDYRNAILFFHTLQQIMIVLAVIGLPVLTIWLLAGPQGAPPQIAHIVAILIGAFFYPLLFILFLCIPFKSAVQKRMNEQYPPSEN